MNYEENYTNTNTNTSTNSNNNTNTDATISKPFIIKGFNKHFDEFIEDVQSVFPEDDEVKTMKNLLFLFKKTNPRLVLEYWNTYIHVPYKEPIENGDISFFVNKDYSADVTMTDGISSFIERLRGYVKNMTEENQQKSMKYIQNLCNLTKLYYS
jgi:hypothetical protein